MVKWTGKLAVLTLALSLQAMPLMVCVLPDSLLTEEDRACCREMADDCGGQMDMPSSHSCCTVTVHQGDPFLVHPIFTSGQSQSAGSPLVGGSEISRPVTPAKGAFPERTHSPPIPRPTIASILRI